MLRHMVTRAPIEFDTEAIGADGRSYTLLRYEPDECGSGHVIAMPPGKWGKANEELFRPLFFRLEVA